MLQASALDAPRPDGSPNFTIDTLHRLATMLNTDETLTQEASAHETPAQASSQSDITVIVGIDAFLHIRDWRSPDALLDGFDWAVVSRPGFDLSRVETIGLTLHQRARVKLIDGVAELVSATAIREALRQRKDVSSLVPPAVLAYIRDHRLYGDSL
jgi:nicotinate-nucleotide adenylyltransferase